MLTCTWYRASLASVWCSPAGRSGSTWGRSHRTERQRRREMVPRYRTCWQATIYLRKGAGVGISPHGTQFPSENLKEVSAPDDTTFKKNCRCPRTAGKAGMKTDQFKPTGTQTAEQSRLHISRRPVCTVASPSRGDGDSAGDLRAGRPPASAGPVRWQLPEAHPGEPAPT